jgi:hypothetical protein
VRIRTDDEVYRVDSVWLGPPKATFPWRTRYVSWGVGMVVFLVVLGIERQLGIGFGFFSTAWGLLVTIVLTRLIGSRISHERPLTAVIAMWTRELTTPRESTATTGGAASAARVRVQRSRPTPGQQSPHRQQSPPRWGRAKKEGTKKEGTKKEGTKKEGTRKEGRGVRARTSAQTGTESRERE